MEVRLTARLTAPCPRFWCMEEELRGFEQELGSSSARGKETGDSAAQGSRINLVHIGSPAKEVPKGGWDFVEPGGTTELLHVSKNPDARVHCLLDNACPARFNRNIDRWVCRHPAEP